MTLWPLSAFRSGARAERSLLKIRAATEALLADDLCPRPEARCSARSVPVGVGLEGASGLHTDVVGLLLREDGELGTERGQVQGGNLLVELLREQVDVVLVA